MNENYEPIETVYYYYDFPRNGIARYQQHPHVYACLYNDVEDEWSEVFLLKPIDQQTYKKAMDAWQQWLKIKERVNFSAGHKQNRDVNIVDSVRSFDQLMKKVGEELDINPEFAIFAKVNFYVVNGDPPSKNRRNFFADWVPVDTTWSQLTARGLSKTSFLHRDLLPLLEL